MSDREIAEMTRGVRGATSRPPTRGSYGVPVRGRMNAYANSKLIGGLWLRQLAEEHPGIYFVSVSPGGVATDVYADAPQPLAKVDDGLEEKLRPVSPRLGRPVLGLLERSRIEAVQRQHLLALPRGHASSGPVDDGIVVEVGTLVDDEM